MRKKLNRGLAIMLAVLTLFSSVPVGATEVEHQHTSESSTQQTEVIYNQESNFSVTIPKDVSLDSDKTSAYEVTVEGDISSDETIVVTPDDSFLMKDISGSQNPKDDVEATVSQTKTEWKFNEFETIGNGLISAEGLTSGNWQGSFYFNISLKKDEVEDENPLSLMVNNVELDSLAMGTGSQQQLTASIEGEDITDLIEWESSNDVITVTNGLIETTASAKPGDSSVITATYEAPAIFAVDGSNNSFKAEIVVTIIDIVFNEVGGSEIITEIDIAPGESKQIEATIIPGSSKEVVNWTSTAVSGINLIANKNQVTVKVASDMEMNQSYFVAATCGSLTKLIKLNIMVDHTCEYEKIIVTEPTCTEKGLASFTCKICNSSYEEEVDILGHDFGDWKTSLNPTCTMVGSQNRTCSVCGGTETKDVAVLGHDFSSEFTVDIEATCTTEGQKSKHCSRCSVATEITTIPISHNYINNVCSLCEERNPGLYDAKGNLLCSWEDSGINNKCSNAERIISDNYPTTKNVVIPSGITSIQEGAFSNASGYNIYIPVTIKTFAYSPFEKTSNVTIYYEGTKEQWDDISKLYGGGNGLDLITIVYNYSSKDLAKEYIEFTLTSSNYTQAGITSLEGDIVIPSEFECEDGYYKVTKIDAFAFKDCSELTSVIIPDSVTHIGAYAFRNCTKLSNIVIPKSVVEIGAYVFEGTAWLTLKQKENPLVIVNGILIDGTTATGKVVIPDNVTMINDNSFTNNKNITSVDISNSVTTIGSAAFSNCDGLTKAYIPSSVIKMETSIYSTSSSPFYDCSSSLILCCQGMKQSGWGTNWDYFGPERGGSSQRLTVKSYITRAEFEALWI